VREKTKALQTEQKSEKEMVSKKVEIPLQKFLLVISSLNEI
jgi:hypothetical protein